MINLLSEKQHQIFQSISGISMNNFHNWIVVLGAALMILCVGLIIVQAFWQYKEEQSFGFATLLLTIFGAIVICALFLTFLT